MQMELLGTGTSQGVPVINCDCVVCASNDPRDKRLRCSVLLRAGTETILIDGGPDMRQQLLRTQVPTLDAVLLTHEHMDHIAGMDDLRTFNFRQQHSMPIYADERTLTAVKRVYSYAFGNTYPGIPKYDLHEVNMEGFAVGNTTVIPIQVMHHKLPVLGYRVGDMGYITDANFISEEEKPKLKGLKVLVLDSLRKEPHLSHFNLEQSLALIEELQVERAYLTHISHLMGKHEEVENELPDHVRLGYDGLVLEV